MNLDLARAVKPEDMKEILSEKHDVCTVYLYLLLHVSEKTCTVKYHEHSIVILKNQLVVLYHELPSELNLPFNVIFESLEYLQKIGVIRQEKDWFFYRNFTVITLLPMAKS